MPVSTAASNTLLTSFTTNQAKYVSLHTAYSATGANEVTGGSPAYARQSLTWGSASGEAISISGSYNLNVPASTTVEFIGFWDAASSGNFAGMAPAGNAVAYAFAAPSSTSTLLAPGSGYASNQQVVVFNTGGSALPSGLSAGTIYFVKSPSSDSFQLSATTGPGTAITLSGDGSGIVQAITPETFGSQGTFTVSSGTWNLV